MRKSGKEYENTEKVILLCVLCVPLIVLMLSYMVINAEEGIREYDKRIAGFAHEAGKGGLSSSRD